VGQKFLAFEYDYQYMIDEIINQKLPDEAEVDVPHIFTEFGLFYCRAEVLSIKFYIRNNKMIEKNGI
jgi:hypothetical protein